MVTRVVDRLWTESTHVSLSLFDDVVPVVLRPGRSIGTSEGCVGAEALAGLIGILEVSDTTTRNKGLDHFQRLFEIAFDLMRLEEPFIRLTASSGVPPSAKTRNAISQTESAWRPLQGSFSRNSADQ